MYVKNVMTEYLSQKGNYSKQVTYKEVRAIAKKTLEIKKILNTDMLIDYLFSTEDKK